jgi:hypothetical protein
MTDRRRLLAGIGGVALVSAAVLVFAPGLFPVPRAHLQPFFDLVTENVGLAGLAGLAATIAVVQGLWSSTTPGSPPPLDAAEREDGPAAQVVGTDFDERLAATGRVGARTTEAEATIRDDLRRVAIDAYRDATGADWETAARAVEDGSWTDDPAAPAFIGGPDAPAVPLRVWFRDVLSEEGAFQRQTTRTIRAIYALGPDDAWRPARFDRVREGEESIDDADEPATTAPTAAAADGEVADG